MKEIINYIITEKPGQVAVLRGIAWVKNIHDHMQLGWI